MTVTSRQELIDYALRKLGAPVINIPVAPEQLEDRVDESLQFFQDFHYDGTERVYLKHQVKGTEIVLTSVAGFQQNELVVSASGKKFIIAKVDVAGSKLITKIVDVPSGVSETFAPLEAVTGQTSGATSTVISKIAGDIENRYIPVSDAVTGIIRAVPWWHITNKSTYMFDPQYQAVMTNFQNLSSSSMIYFSQLMSHIALLDQVLRPIESLRFNRNTGKIFLDFDWTTAEIGSYIVVECYRILDPEDFVGIYNDRMLKKLVTAKIKYQYATNCQKYQGIQLIGGVTVDASALMAQAVAEIEAAENEIKDAYFHAPIGFLG